MEDAPAVPTDGSPAPNAWAQASSKLQLLLTVARPIVPEWKPPPKPAKTLSDLIPPRDLHPKPPPVTASEDFKAQVEVVARALAREYSSVFPTPESALVVEAGTRHKQLVFELNRSGKYLQLKDSLRKAVVRIVRERFLKSGSMSPNEMAQVSAFFSHFDYLIIIVIIIR